ncbi:MAG TPA: phage tail sheath subtilisin-like domain-containing protein [Chloroflexota bacterium]|nr:phage tail sheath subtilisin-like domain-containing protein [Chloroflexota bacterium]
MATSYQTPGVYVEEMPPGSQPIEGVGTSVAAFIGFAEMGPRNKPTLITNWSQFVEKFGSFHDGYYLAHSVYGYFANGGGTCFVVNIAPSLAPQAMIPAASDGNTKPSLEIYAIRQGLSTPGLTVDIDYGDGFAALPPGPATPASAEESKPGDPKPKASTPAAKPADGGAKGPDSSTPFSLKVKRGRDVLEEYEGATMDRESPKYVEMLVNGASQYIWLSPPAAKAAMIPAPRPGNFALQTPASTALQVSTSDFMGKIQDRSGIEGLEAVDEITIVCAPDLMSAYKRGLIGDDALVGLQKAMLTHCEGMQDRVAIIDAPPGLDPQGMLEWRNKTMIDSQYGALYYPWIKVLDPLDPTGKRLLSIPPCGHMAGIWARTDSERGVHKAPANEVVRGAVDVAQEITHGEQGLLNPKGVNCIRTFGTRGIRVWGARTLSSDAAWKYINVRRLFNYIEESIKQGTQWAVFEPNNFSLWQQLKRDITSFLLRPYRDGALFGATQDQAFYVKCDSETNPPDVIDAGIVIVEVGICPTKPAEFVVFRVRQLPTGGAAA